MNIKTCLEKYSDEFYSEMYGMHPNRDKTTSLKEAKEFLARFAMDSLEYERKCVPVMRKIFLSTAESYFDIRKKSMTELLREEYDFFSYQSSPLFWKESYMLIQAICKDFGDKYLYIVEEERCEECADAAFKIKLPINASWDTISRGGCITDVLFNMFRNNYYVFGDSGNWGKWCDYDNDYIDYEVFCYKSLMQSIQVYKDYFSISREEYDSLRNLPNNLRVGFWNSITGTVRIRISGDGR